MASMHAHSAFIRVFSADVHASNDISAVRLRPSCQLNWTSDRDIVDLTSLSLGLRLQDAYRELARKSEETLPKKLSQLSTNCSDAGCSDLFLKQRLHLTSTPDCSTIFEKATQKFLMQKCANRAGITSAACTRLADKLIFSQSSCKRTDASEVEYRSWLISLVSAIKRLKACFSDTCLLSTWLSWVWSLLLTCLLWLSWVWVWSLLQIPVFQSLYPQNLVMFQVSFLPLECTNDAFLIEQMYKK